MEHSEFEIGEEFWCSGRQWRCTDIGTRTIVAMRLDHVEVGSEVPERYRILSRAEAEAEGWFKGPPYAVAERVFDEYDMEGCSPEPELQTQHTAPTYSIPDCGSQWGSGEGLWKYTFETCILPQ